MYRRGIAYLSVDRAGVCFPHQEHGLDPRWEPFLDELVERGLCTPPKREALLSWHGYITPSRTALPWPEPWLTESLLRPPDTFGLFDRRLSHVKMLTFSPSQPPAAKAYLGFGHLWIELGGRPASGGGRPKRGGDLRRQPARGGYGPEPPEGTRRGRNGGRLVSDRHAEPGRLVARFL